MYEVPVNYDTSSCPRRRSLSAGPVFVALNCFHVVQFLKGLNMRLLNAKTKQVEDFQQHIPKYAILSHVWGEEEVTFQDINKPHAHIAKTKGYAKVKACCTRALKDGYEYVWIDTCCIDNSSSAELSEAINSMYLWYYRSEVCYAYLADVRSDCLSDFSLSKWFTRGWTLQELIAPANVTFLAQDWKRIGSKTKMVDDLVRITGVDRSVLLSKTIPTEVSVAKRMSWAAKRETTREEDRAYSLMGLFGITMSTKYGEGRNAFFRLQRAIMKKSIDQTIFAWKDARGGTSGLLASSPSSFESVDRIPFDTFEVDFVRQFARQSPRVHFSMTNNGVRITLPIKRTGQNLYLAALRCSSTPDSVRPLCIQLQMAGGHRGQFVRTGIDELVDIDVADGTGFEWQHIYVVDDIPPVGTTRSLPLPPCPHARLQDDISTSPSTNFANSIHGSDNTSPGSARSGWPEHYLYKAEALHDYTATFDVDDMSFRQGEILEVVNCHKIWWQARKADGTTGCVPASHLQIVGLSPPCKATTICGYTASANDELSFSKGEVLEVLDTTGMWWQARKGDGTEGTVRRNYLQVMEFSPVLSGAADDGAGDISAISPSEPYSSRARGMYARLNIAADPDQSEILEIIDKEPKGWLARKKDGSIRSVPSDYFQVIEPPPESYSYRAEALYAYTASPDDPNEISFVVGEVLEVVDTEGKWWQVKKSDGTVGIARFSYLRIIESSRLIPDCRGFAGTAVPETPPSASYQAKVLYAHIPSPNDPNRVSFAEGETLDIIDKEEKWWLVRKADGTMSTVPASSLQVMNLPPESYTHNAMVLYAYTASPDDPHEVSLSQGELLEVVYTEGKWFQVKKADGSVGIARHNYLRTTGPITRSLDATAAEFSVINGNTNQGGNSRPYHFRAKALYNYTAPSQHPGDISFGKGEILDIIDKQGAWWKAKKSDGTIGDAPSNYLRVLGTLLTLSTPAKTISTKSTLPTRIGAKARYAGSKSPNDPNDRIFVKGEQLDIIDKEEKWWLARKADGTMRTIPSRSFQMIEPPLGSYSHLAMALFAYTASRDDPNEISFVQGELLQVVDITAKWWQVKKQNGIVGSTSSPISLYGAYTLARPQSRGATISVP
ncbi:hypothetical protein BV22DRAFT_1061737 [Leucogyrophana mollusca]|uniref:Uncharacterized protein n=1 Tax=Leucogyrophana mollusca TaxID=85980 RepID=A0ACB8BP22_9AGAM|nr:hypothetical protein BV22DRAFT_1061737 [Leucogyrophana mollusca]